MTETRDNTSLSADPAFEKFLLAEFAQLQSRILAYSQKLVALPQQENAKTQVELQVVNYADAVTGLMTGPMLNDFVPPLEVAKECSQPMALPELPNMVTTSVCCSDFAAGADCSVYHADTAAQNTTAPALVSAQGTGSLLLGENCESGVIAAHAESEDSACSAPNKSGQKKDVEMHSSGALEPHPEPLYGKLISEKSECVRAISEKSDEGVASRAIRRKSSARDDIFAGPLELSSEWQRKDPGSDADGTDFSIKVFKSNLNVTLPQLCTDDIMTRRKPGQMDVLSSLSGSRSKFFRLKQMSFSHHGRTGLSKQSKRMQNLSNIRRSVSALESIMMSEAQRQKFQRAISDPTSRVRRTWDILGLILLAWDLFTIPLSVFEMSGNGFMKVMQLLVFFYWFVDIPACFFAGYYRDGIIEIRMDRTARKYISSWFPLDVVLVSVDAITIFGGDDVNTYANVGKSFRVLRFLRALRLLRLAKAPKLVEQIEEAIQSEYVHILVSIAKLTVFLFAVSHFIACGWYALGKDGYDNSKSNWLAAAELQHSSVGYQYSTSLHWSLTQFTPASMEVRPYNVLERTYSVIVLLFAMVTFSSYISSLTTAMTSLRNINSDSHKQIMVLQRYMRINRIPLSLSVRVTRQLDYVLQERMESLREKDVPILGFLTEPMMIELRYELYAGVLKQHPFFNYFDSANFTMMEKLCHQAVEERFLQSGDSLFFNGDEAKFMYFMKTEGMRYQSGDDLAAGGGEVHEIAASKWLCELALWTSWSHRGNAWTVTNSHIVALDAHAFKKIVNSNTHAHDQARHYAAIFVDSCNNCRTEPAHDREVIKFDILRAIGVAFIEGDEDQKSDQDSDEGHPGAGQQSAIVIPIGNN